MNRVFIVTPHSGAYDYSAAAEHGTLERILIREELNPFRMEDLTDHVRLTLEHLEPTVNDRWVFGGNAYTACCVSIYLAKKFGEFTVLVYGAKSQKYVQKQIKARYL